MPSKETADTATQEGAKELIDAPLDVIQYMPSIGDLLPEAMLPYWKLLQQYPLLEATVVLLCFWLLAYIVRYVTINFITRLASKTTTDVDDQIIERLKRPIFLTIVWIGIIAATAAASFNAGWTRYIAPISLSFIVFIWLRASLQLSSLILRMLSQDHRVTSIDVRTEPLLIIVSKILLLVIGSYILLIIWGINPVGLLASAGIVGIAVGFAAKDTLANLFSGMFILADRPYKLGDYVNLDTGERGKVTHIGIRSTRLITRDDIEITIPNGVIGNAKVVNESGGPYQKMRIRLNLQCAYESNLDEVCDLLMQITDTQELVCTYPSPRVRVRGFGDSGIDIQLMGWIDKPEDRGRIMHILYMTIHEEFGKANIEIPYPKRDLNIINNDV